MSTPPITPPSAPPAAAAAVSRLSAFALRARFGETGGDQAEGRRHQHRAAHALDEPRRDDLPALLRQPGREARHDEQQQAGHERPPAPEQVTDPAAEQQEAGEGERVAAHHPLQAGRREPEACPASAAAPR